MVTKKDYNEIAVEAAQSVLIELIHLLGEHWEHIVLIGGWVPHFLYGRDNAPHTGSIDVDLALNHRHIDDTSYETIQQLLIDRGYEQGRQPFIFFRSVRVENLDFKVQVDLLSGEYEGTGKSHRHQRVQDVHARKVRGCDLAFEKPIEIKLEGTLPNGAIDAVTIRVASIVPFFVMKGIALAERLKEKDAWDIYYCLKHHPGGLDALAELFQPFLNNSLVKEGLLKIREQFASPDHVGPTFIADFEELIDVGERQIVQRDAFERIQYLLAKLGVL